ncbi:hypothetical protein A0H81_12689 [Grifola frondosa]|uniref:DUF6533 domain-containing protein n=1 Tax=Grifola frondosa TaxID=5627 RepID=A0A1C7LRS4_GRIFR|nr:hypothetical protein A0H81_12689 [Grifola frondosa]
MNSIFGEDISSPLGEHSHLRLSPHFGFEVRYIWDRPFSGATLLFLINRYANVIVTLFTYLSVTIAEPSHLT